MLSSWLIFSSEGASEKAGAVHLEPNSARENAAGQRVHCRLTASLIAGVWMEMPQGRYMIVVMCCN